MGNKVIITCILFAVSGLTAAADADKAADKDKAAEVKFASPESDKANYRSDRILYRFDTQVVVVVDTTTTAQSATTGCLPAGTSLKGRGKATLKRLDGEGLAEPKVMEVFTVNSEPEERKPDIASQARRCTAGSAVRKGDVVLVDPQQLVSTPPHRFGFTYGTLLVPYKYHYKGDREFASGATLGGYLGYREASTGLAMQYITFAGATSVSATDKGSDGKSVTRNLTGVSYGLGVLGTVKDGFQMGVVVGADRVGKGSNYVNNGKPWVALSLGFGFSN